MSTETINWNVSSWTDAFAVYEWMLNPTIRTRKNMQMLGFSEYALNNFNHAEWRAEMDSLTAICDGKWIGVNHKLHLLPVTNSKLLPAKDGSYKLSFGCGKVLLGITIMGQIEKVTLTANGLSISQQTDECFYSFFKGGVPIYCCPYTSFEIFISGEKPEKVIAHYVYTPLAIPDREFELIPLTADRCEGSDREGSDRESDDRKYICTEGSIKCLV